MLKQKKLEINHRKGNEKKTDYMETKLCATRKTNGSNKEVKKKLKNTLKQMKKKEQ